MNNLAQFDWLVSFFPWGFLKVLTIILCGVYVFYSIIIIRQERLMAKVIEIPFIPILRMIAIIHFIASVLALLMALVLI